MTTIFTGTTNTDGSGTAGNLNEENSTVVLSPNSRIVTEEDVVLTNLGSGVVALNQGMWNQEGFKEVKFSTEKDYVSVDNFVDVNVSATNSSAATISIASAKRGDISTSEGNDSIYISAYSNASSDTGWANMFNIQSGSGEDVIRLTDSKNSQWTEFNIDAGSGHDLVDVSGMLNPSENVNRFADGGDGFDMLVFSGDNSLEFENFEAVIGSNGAQLDLDSDLLASNDTLSDFGLGLILSNVELSTSLSIDTNDMLSEDEIALLEAVGLNSDDFKSVTLIDADNLEYSILTDDAAFA